MSANQEDSIFESLLNYIKQSRGFDFTGYKRTSLQRRVRKQMQTRNIDTYGDYLDYLEAHPEEFVQLFNTILINVTGFFRDSLAWEYLAEQVLPSILENALPHKPIRIWSVGCSSGEEAYTLVMLLTELLGIEQFRQRVKLYATDVDEDALAHARLASYTERELEGVPTDLREKYFEPAGNNYIFRADLRRAVIFGRHDLVQDAPISRLDLLICRNTLMYFNAEAQGRILGRFHFALKDTGVLFLGKAEMLLTHTKLFSPISMQHRIFSKMSKVNLRDRLMILAQGGTEEVGNRFNPNLRLRDAAFNAAPVAQIVLDLNGVLAIFNTLARSMFGLGLQSIGRPIQDLEISYRPLELRSHIEQVYREQHSVTVKDVACNLVDGTVQYLDVQFVPLRENDSALLGISITFADVTNYHRLQEELQRSNQELETANEELQSSNEELETTNEELQSTNEELETTNEELQSTNEELETMNEELQSTNEELQTINEELHERTGEVNHINAFLKSVLSSIRAGVVVVDNQFNIVSWNQESENLWGLQTEEVEGQSFLGLEIGLPVLELRELIRRCIAGENQLELVVESVNRRGRTFNCRVTSNPLIGADGTREGVILVMEEI
jgi:two-component system CheB/CheR fusion protein